MFSVDGGWTTTDLKQQIRGPINASQILALLRVYYADVGISLNILVDNFFIRNKAMINFTQY